MSGALSEIKKSEFQAEGLTELLRDKVSKRFGADPVPEKKTYDYLTDMLEESVTLANSTGQGNLQREDKVDRIHVLAPEERPAGQEIIKKRLEMSRF